MIWHSTTKFGCGKARSRSGKVVAVAYYEPKGNIPGHYHENVLPPVIESEDEDEDPEIVEASGMVASIHNPGVYYVIQDSQNPNKVYSFLYDGESIGNLYLLMTIEKLSVKGSDNFL